MVDIVFYHQKTKRLPGFLQEPLGPNQHKLDWRFLTHLPVRDCFLPPITIVSVHTSLLTSDSIKCLQLNTETRLPYRFLNAACVGVWKRETERSRVVGGRVVGVQSARKEYVYSFSPARWEDETERGRKKYLFQHTQHIQAILWEEMKSWRMVGGITNDWTFKSSPTSSFPSSLLLSLSLSIASFPASYLSLSVFLSI